MNRLRALLWSGVVVLSAGAIWTGVVLMPGGPTGVRVGDAQRMERLGAYLEPASGTAVIQGERGTDMVRDPFDRAVAMAPTQAGSATSSQPTLRVSAILISGDRRLAIVDDRVVAPGDVLPGGERVAEIRPDAVVVTRRDGTRQMVRIDKGEGP